MERPATQVVIDAGLLNQDTIDQLKRWGLLAADGKPHESISDPEAIVAKFRAVLESDETVEIRYTDLDIIRQFLTSKQSGRLYVTSPDNSKAIAIPIEFCITKMGEYVIPWSSESICDMLTDDGTYLKPHAMPKVKFCDVRELYFDGHKAFVVCTTIKKE